MTEHEALLLSILRKDGVTNGVGRVSGSNEQGRKHKVVSVSNEHSRFYNRRTLDRSTPESYVIKFDMGIITNYIRSFNGWQR